MGSCINKKFFVLTSILLGIGVSFFTYGQDRPTKEESASSIETKKVTPSKAHVSRDISAVHVHSLGLGVGQTFLSSKLQKTGENKITGELFYNYSASHTFDAVANLHYSKHSFRGHYTKLSGLALSIKGKLFQFDALAPFALTGLGFYAPQVSRTIDTDPTPSVYYQVVESDKKLTFGVNLGLGAELRLNRHFMLWLLGHYHNPFHIKQDVGPKVDGHYKKLLLVGFYSF